MQPVAKNLAKVTRKVMQTHGAAWAGLITNWRDIAGPQLRDISLPEKVIWHGGKSASPSAKKLGGTLVLKVAWGRALEVQYSIPQILDKISTYYGYQAITAIKIIQAEVEVAPPPTKPQLPPLQQDQRQLLDRQMQNIVEDDLKGALARLARGVMAQKIRQR